jgi:ligand-binding SRPBCC domain-containing protein
MLYEKTSPIACSAEEAFAFHCDIQNLPKLSPPDTVVEILNDVKTFEKGTVIELRAQKGYKSMHWIVEIENFNPPHSFTDTARKSPFKSWRHTHEFFEKEGKSYMRDVVELELPLGWFGRLFENYAKKELETMFSYRHNALNSLMDASTP